MVSTGVLYMKGMNTESDDEIEEDIWDDRKLNDAYDKALKMANLEVAKRVAMATNTVNFRKEKTEETSQTQPSQEKSNKHKKSKLNKAQKKAQKKESKHSWKEGMQCRAMYSVDGFDYEAVVLTILDDENCVIRYLGYNNTEIVPISSLQPSLGKQARKDQMMEALAEKDEDQSSTRTSYMDNDLSDGPQIPEFNGITHNKLRTSKSKRGELNTGFAMPNIPMPDVSMLRDFGQMDMPTPPPPLVGLQGGHAFNDDQALSNMLVSWYMSGYYTGLYHGMKRQRQRRRDC